MDIKWIVGTVLGLGMLVFTGMYALDTRKLVNHQLSHNEENSGCAALEFIDGNEDILVLPANSNDDSAKRFADFLTKNSKLGFVSYQLDYRAKDNFTRNVVMFDGEHNRDKAQQFAAILPGMSVIWSFAENQMWTNPEGRDFFVALGAPYLESEGHFVSSLCG